MFHYWSNQAIAKIPNEITAIKNDYWTLRQDSLKLKTVQRGFSIGDPVALAAVLSDFSYGRNKIHLATATYSPSAGAEREGGGRMTTTPASHLRALLTDAQAMRLQQRLSTLPFRVSYQEEQHGPSLVAVISCTITQEKTVRDLLHDLGVQPQEPRE